MKKNIWAIILILLIGVGITIIILSKYPNTFLDLEKYTLEHNERIIKNFKYDKYNYAISSLYDSGSTWSDINILLEYKNEYYILTQINGCDTTEKAKNLYISENKLYIHCIGQKGNIYTYTIEKNKVTKELLEFNYDKTPNISQLHIEIDKVDTENIFLSSPFKVDNTVADEPKVMCSLKNKVCNYY